MPASPKRSMMSPYEKLLAALLAAKVQFAVIGGLACALCGWSRATVDIDLLVRHESTNIERVLTCLSDYGTGAARELTPDDFTDEPGAIRVMEGFAIDIFVRNKIKSASIREQDRFDVAVLRRIVAGERLDTQWPS